MSRVLLSAADASGDLHAAELVEALRARRPEASLFGVGGDHMARAGVELLAHQRELAVGGFVEVLSSVGRVLAAWRRVGRAARERPPDLAILVDSPDFNLPLARRLRRRGIPVLYYVSPQVWAWRRGRARKLARRVDRLAVIFPFESACYAGTGLDVEFVGHPLVQRLEEVRRKHDRSGARAALELPPEAPVVLLLPGSRRNELRYGLPVMLETARQLRERVPDVVFVLALAPTLEREEVESRLAEAEVPAGLRPRLVQGRTWEAARAADVALAKPGTITVELALLGCPLVVVGRANPVSVAIARRIVRVPSFTMPNLIAGAPVVPEFLQEAARPERVAAALADLLDGPARELQLARLAEVRRRLGRGGAARRAAEIADEMLGAPRVAA